jgi:hypothetical protein
MAKKVMNQGEARGVVWAGEFSYTDKVVAKGKVTLKIVEEYEYQGVATSKELYPSFDFFGKPAQKCIDMGIKKGDQVVIVYKLGSFPAKDKVDVHYTKVQGIICRLATPSDSPAEKEDDIPFE